MKVGGWKHDNEAGEGSAYLDLAFPTGNAGRSDMPPLGVGLR